MLAALDNGGVFLNILWMFFLFLWLVILFQIIADLFRDHETSGIAKAVWIGFLLFFPPITMIVYLIVRGGGMAERSMKQQASMQQEFDKYVQGVAGSSGGPADQIAKGKQLLDAGAITQAEFDQMKAKALS